MTSKIDEFNAFVSGTGANAIKVNQNFNKIKDTINETIDDIAVLETDINEANIKFDKILSSVFIGQIIPFCRSDYPAGVLPCNGSEYSRTTFNTFYREYLLTGKVLTCSYDVYEEQIATYGHCGMFGLDAINSKFKTPTLDSSFIMPTVLSSEIGKCFKQGLPNITGSFNIGSGQPIATKDHEGAIEPLAIGGAYPYGANATTSTYGAKINASKSNEIYGASEDVLPKHIKYYFGVVVANISEDVSEISWSEVISELSNKLNKPSEFVDETTTEAVISNLSENTVYKFNTNLTSLTIANYQVSNISSSAWFTAGAGFNLAFTNPPKGYIPSLIEFEEGSKYVLTMNNGYVIFGKVE